MRADGEVLPGTLDSWLSGRQKTSPPDFGRNLWDLVLALRRYRLRPKLKQKELKNFEEQRFVRLLVLFLVFQKV